MIFGINRFKIKQEYFIEFGIIRVIQFVAKKSGDFI